MNDTFTTIGVLAVYWGFAGVWGALLKNGRKSGPLASLIFGLLVVLPASIALPGGLFFKLGAWAGAGLLAGVFAVQPRFLPARLWQGRSACLYFGALMLPIAAWAALAGQPLTAWGLGIPAACAALFGWRHAFVN